MEYSAGGIVVNKGKLILVYEKEKFYVKDCQLDTDLEVLIPDIFKYCVYS